MATSLYGQTILADGAQGYYRLNEASGSVAHDLTRNHNDATLSSVSAYGQPGALFNDGDTSLTFAGGGTLTLPAAFSSPAWSVFSLDFWMNGVYTAMTVNGATTLTYLNTVPSAPGATYVMRALTGTIVTPGVSTLTVSTIVSWLATYVMGSNLDEVGVYKFVLLPIQIQNHYYIGTQG